MGRMGRWEYPNYGIEDTINWLEKIKTFVKKGINGEITKETVAEATGSSSANSGTFLAKIAALSQWGLATAAGKGKIKLTDQAKGILYPVDREEKKIAVANAVRSVKLWNEIYQQFGEVVTEEQLKRFFRDKGNVDVAKVDKETGRVVKLYMEAVPYLKSETKFEKEEVKMVRDEGREMEVPSKAEGVIKIEAGKLQQIFPYTSEGLELAKPYLSEAMIKFLETGLKGKEKEKQEEHIV